MSSSTVDPQQQQHPVTATKMGSRRIFPAQFKLQVLNSYRNDSDCKGNQRATARKYGIHRRQIQKWLQCEANLRSSVVLNGGKASNNNNINNTNQYASAATGKPVPAATSNKAINGPAEHGRNFINGIVTANKLSYVAAAPEPTLRQMSNNNSGVFANSGAVALSKTRPESAKGRSIDAPDAASNASMDANSFGATFNAAPTAIYPHAAVMPSVENCLRGPCAFGLPLPATNYHPHLYGITPVLDGYKYVPSPFVGYVPHAVQEPVRPSPIYLWAGNRDDLPSSAITANPIIAPIDLSTCSSVPSAATSTARRPALPRQPTPVKPYFWAVKPEERAHADKKNPSATIEEKPWDLSSANNRKRQLVHEHDDEGISLSRHESVTGTSHRSSLTASKATKLFRPYASDDEDVVVDVDHHDHDEPAKKYWLSDKQREPIIWSNHPNYSQPFQSSYWLSHGSPVSGYDSGSSTFSACSDDGHCNDAICTGARYCLSTATSPSIGSQRAESAHNSATPQPSFSDSEDCEAPMVVANTSTSSTPTNYRRELLQRWSAHEENDCKTTFLVT